MDTYRIDFESLPWQSPMAGVRFKAHQQGGRLLRLIEFSREFLEQDWCRNGHIGYVLKGELEIDFSGTVVVFKQGDGLFIPAGEPGKHKARARTHTVQLVLVEDL